MDKEAQKKQLKALKALVAKGKEQGFLTYAEVNDNLPKVMVDPEQIEDIDQQTAALIEQQRARTEALEAAAQKSKGSDREKLY